MALLGLDQRRGVGRISTCEYFLSFFFCLVFNKKFVLAGIDYYVASVNTPFLSHCKL